MHKKLTKDDADLNDLTDAILNVTCTVYTELTSDTEKIK